MALFSLIDYERGNLPMQEKTSMTRARANQRLQQIQSQMYQLTEEAKTLAGYLNGVAAEEHEMAAKAQADAEQAAQAPEKPAGDPAKPELVAVGQGKTEADKAKETKRPSVG